MIGRLLPFLGSLLNLSYFERKKIALLGGNLFCVIAAYSVLRPLKTSVFLKLVGISYQPYTKLLMIAIIFPVMYLYAVLIDRVKKENIVHIIFVGYAVACLLFAYFLFDPVTGLPNTETSPRRLVGWLFYIAMDLFSPLIMTTFWSYTNAINTPSSASSGYGFITVASRLGGLLSSEGAYQWLSSSIEANIAIPLFIVVSAGLLLIGSLFTHLITTGVPAEYLEGYKPEARMEAKDEENRKAHGDESSGDSSANLFDRIVAGFKQTFEGLRLLVSKPYVFGIFGIVYGFEIISAILDYQMQYLMVVGNNNSVKESSLFLFRYTTLFQLVGLFFAVFGTGPLLKKWGIRLCLAITPIVTMSLMAGLLFHNSLFLITSIMIILRGLNYGFNTPVREMLFIPTSHDIRYKAKAWIESAGRTFSKSSGAIVNITSQQAATLALTVSTLFSFSVAFVWLVIALLVGRKYNNALAQNKVIGRDA